jgi:hypothetical protein
MFRSLSGTNRRSYYEPRSHALHSDLNHCVSYASSGQHKVILYGEKDSAASNTHLRIEHLRTTSARSLIG